MRVRVRGVLAAALLGLAAVGSGCSGVNANGSVSPASFFLPGLMEVRPPAPAPGDSGSEPAVALAMVRSDLR